MAAKITTVLGPPLWRFIWILVLLTPYSTGLLKVCDKFFVTVKEMPITSVSHDMLRNQGLINFIVTYWQPEWT